MTQRSCFSRILKTGVQYLLVDSMQTSVQLNFASQSHSSFTPLGKGRKESLFILCAIVGIGNANIDNIIIS